MSELSLNEFFNPERYFEYEGLPGTQGSIYLSQEEDPKIKAIVIGSNACDILHKKISHIHYFPIFFCSDLLKTGKRSKIKKNWLKIIKQNHPEFIYLPPDNPNDEREKIINDPIGAIISLQFSFSLNLDDFFKKYNTPILRLSFIIREKFSEKISYLFNRTPLLDPINNELENWVMNNILARFDYFKILEYIKEKKQVSLQELFKKFKSNLKQENIEKLLEKMKESNMIQIDENNFVKYIPE